MARLHRAAAGGLLIALGACAPAPSTGPAAAPAYQTQQIFRQAPF